MFDALNKFFQNNLADQDKTDGADQMQIATCALLLEAAHADDEFSPAERDTVGQVLQRRFQLDDAGTAELIHLAEEERRQSTDMYQFARLINDAYSRPRKLAIVELLWEVVFSDGVLEAHEDALMHKLGSLLGVRHEELMALKLKVKRSRD